MQSIDWYDYRQGLLFLITAGVIAPLFRRLRLSPVFGFVTAGIVLGPFGLGRLVERYPALTFVTLADVGRFAGLASFGVVFLLFMIGLELSFERLVRLKRLVFGLGFLQVGVSAAVFVSVAVWMGQSAASAVVIGAALSLSSTAIVIPALAERRRLSTAAGRATLAVLLFQDLMVAPFLFTVSMLGARSGQAFGLGAFSAVASAAAAIGIIVLVGRLLLRPMFHLVARARSTEFFVAACLLVVLGTGLVAASAGLSMSLGAFIAGLLLAETEFRREVEVTIEPFKGLLLGLFFVSVGARLDFDRVWEDPGLILGVAAGLIALKAIVLFGLGHAFRLPKSAPRQLALLLAPGGEFAFVMLAAATAAGVVPLSLGANLAVAVTLSMATIPVLAWLALRSARPRPEIDPALAELAPPADAGPRILIAGYGRVGRLVGEMVARHSLPFVAFDADAILVASERRGGVPIYFGDATRPEFLRRCGVAEAKALIVTMDNPRAVEETVVAARKERSDLTIVARARDPHHAHRLYELGATDAVPETMEASLQLSEAALVDIGIPMGLVIASIHEKRDEFRRMLQVPEKERRGIRLSTRVKKIGRRTEESRT